MVRVYRSKLREQHAAATRAQILDAAWALLATTRPADLRYEAIAERAEVSVRTVYRHFPTSDHLFLGLSDRLFAILAGPDGGSPTHRSDGPAFLRRQFEAMERDPAVFRAFFAVPTRSRIQGPHPLEVAFADVLDRVPEAQRRAAIGLLDLVCSPYAWDVLHANWGCDARQVTRASLVAIQALLDALQRDPGALDPDLPDPS